MDLVNNLWVLLAGLLVFTMTIAVGLLEVGELGEGFSFSLLKTAFMTGAALVIMAAVGFNLAFAPTWNGIFGNPFYGPGFFLGGFSSSSVLPTSDIWWSVQSQGLAIGTYFLFETAFAAVTFALVGVIFLRKVKLTAIGLYSIVYFLIIWTLPAAWIWNPSGWLAKMGMVDFAGGLVVHGAGRCRRARHRGPDLEGGTCPRSLGEPPGSVPDPADLADVGGPLALARMVWFQPRERPPVQRRGDRRSPDDILGRGGSVPLPTRDRLPRRRDSPGHALGDERDLDGSHRHHPPRGVRQPGRARSSSGFSVDPSSWAPKRRSPRSVGTPTLSGSSPATSSAGSSGSS